MNGGMMPGILGQMLIQVLAVRYAGVDAGNLRCPYRAVSLRAFESTCACFVRGRGSLFGIARSAPVTEFETRVLI